VRVAVGPQAVDLQLAGGDLLGQLVADALEVLGGVPAVVLAGLGRANFLSAMARLRR